MDAPFRVSNMTPVKCQIFFSCPVLQLLFAISNTKNETMGQPGAHGTDVELCADWLQCVDWLILLTLDEEKIVMKKF